MQTYHLKTVWSIEEEVTLDQWIQAEQAAGFFPKSGNGPATGGFSSGSISGRIKTFIDCLSEDGKIHVCEKDRPIKDQDYVD